VAASLRREPGVEVAVVNGNKGEFTVSVGGQIVAQKVDALPPVEEVVNAVRQTEPNPAGV